MLMQRCSIRHSLMCEFMSIYVKIYLPKFYKKAKTLIKVDLLEKKLFADFCPLHKLTQTFQHLVV